MIPTFPNAGLQRVRWVVIVFKWKQNGAGAAVVPKQTESAVVLPDAETARLWLRDKTANGQIDHYRMLNYIDGDPTSWGVDADEWNYAPQRVYWYQPKTEDKK